MSPSPTDPKKIGSENSQVPNLFESAFTPTAFCHIPLSKNEKLVFDVLIRLTLGTNVSRIAKRAKLPRTTTAYILKKFVNRKIARKGKFGRRNVYCLNRGLNNIDRKKYKE